MREVTRSTKRQKRAELFQLARSAAQARDARTFFQIIRKLAPKTPRKPIHLRHPAGKLLGVEEAADHLCEWYEALFLDDHHTESALPPLTWFPQVDSQKVVCYEERAWKDSALR